MAKGGGTAGGSRGGAPRGGGGIERGGGGAPRTEGAPKAPVVEAGGKHTPQEKAGIRLQRPTETPNFAHRLALGKDTRYVRERLPYVQASIQRLQREPAQRDAEKRPQPIDKRPRLADLKTKVTKGAREPYTPQEQYYLQHGWKAYLRTYGEQRGYSLEEIARTEKLDAGAIKQAITEGVVKDPASLRLYGQLKTEQTRAFFTQWVKDHPQDKALADAQIAYTEEVCRPLTEGSQAELGRFALREAVSNRLAAAYGENSNGAGIPSQARRDFLLTAGHWHDMVTQAFTKAGIDPQAQTKMEESEIASQLARKKQPREKVTLENITRVGEERVARDEAGNIRFIGTQAVTYEQGRLSSVGGKRAEYDEAGRLIALGTEKVTYLSPRKIDPVFARGILEVLGKDGLRPLLRAMRETAHATPTEIPAVSEAPEPEEEKVQEESREEDSLFAFLLEILMGIGTETETAASPSQVTSEAEAAESADAASAEQAKRYSHTS